MDRSGSRSADGQAAVSLVSTLPFIVIGVMVCAQLALTGHALWAAGVAARAGARAELIGSDPEDAARRALPSHLELGFELKPEESGAVRVDVRVPNLIPTLPRISVSAASGLGPGTPALGANLPAGAGAGP